MTGIEFGEKLAGLMLLLVSLFSVPLAMIGIALAGLYLVTMWGRVK